MTWDFQGRNGTSKAVMGLPRPDLAGRTGGGNCQVGRWEQEFDHRRWDI